MVKDNFFLLFCPQQTWTKILADWTWVLTSFSSNYCTVLAYFSSLLISWSGCHLRIYICTTLNGSLFWECLHWNSAFTTSFGKVFCRSAVTSLKKHFLGLFCTWLVLDLFDCSSSRTGRVCQQVHVCPFFLHTACSVRWSYLHLVPLIPHISLLI